MSKVYKIWENTLTKSYVMAEQGTNFSLEPYRDGTHLGMIDNRYYEGFATDTGFVLEFASNVEVAQSNSGDYLAFVPGIFGGLTPAGVFQAATLRKLEDGKQVRDYAGVIIGTIWQAGQADHELAAWAQSA